jgi:uncharacterized protein YdeI (BOF family)
MANNVKTISQYIENQFPGIYQEDAANLVALLQGYYEFLEESDKYSHYLTRHHFEINDIDETFDDFLVHYKEKYLADFPFNTQTDKRFVIKHIMDFYRTKGSRQSLELLMQILYGEETTVYYPGQDILRVSDSKWYAPIYLELTASDRTKTFQDKQITGSISGAKAFVEGVVTKRVDGKIIDVAYLSDVRGSFEYDELITDDGTLENAPRIVGSMNEIEVNSGGSGYAIGDIVDVSAPQGRQGKGRITSVGSATGVVEFELLDGGWGFTNNEFTNVYVSDAVIFVDNENLDFIDFEPVRQNIEKVSTISSEDINATWEIGNTIEGYNGDDDLVANGIILSVANTNSNGAIVSANTSQSIITILVNDGTFGDQYKIVFDANVAFSIGEYIEEASEYELEVSIDSGPGFQVGETIVNSIESANGTILTWETGIVTAVNGTIVQVGSYFGDIAVNDVIISDNTNTEATISAITSTSIGARGLISSQVSSDTYIIQDVIGTLNANNLVRGTKSRVSETISTIDSSGASDVYVSGNSSVNGVVDTVLSAPAEGIVIGQNTTAIGVYGNNYPFYSLDEFNLLFDANNDINITIETNRGEILSPPRDANGDIIEISTNVNRVSTGSSAGFDVGYIENAEEVTFNSDRINGNNAVGIPYASVNIDGTGTGIGFVDSITVNSGGTGYANGQAIVFDGGGYDQGEPLVNATGTITTDGTGAIDFITIDNPGGGYFDTPNYTFSSAGVGADITINMDYGWGFPALPDGDISSVIGDLLTIETMTIGSIASLDRVNPGINYNTNPFVRVYNPYIAPLDKKDIIVNIENKSGGFRVGERIYQSVDSEGGSPGTFYKGYIKFANNSVIILDRTNLNVGFDINEPIYGELSTSSADIESVTQDFTSDTIGDNANVASEVISANGVIQTLEVYDSGYGYEPDIPVTISMANNETVATGIAKVSKQGQAEGYWTTTSSHLNSEKKIHDNFYYQEYSYDIQSGISLREYEDVIRKVTHLAGTELFGSVEKKSVSGAEIDVSESSIEKE